MMLIAGILLEIPILMVILSRVLNYHINRWANIIISLLTILVTLSNGVNDMDDIWFLSIASMGLLYIMWTAWTWRKNRCDNYTRINIEISKIVPMKRIL